MNKLLTICMLSFCCNIVTAQNIKLDYIKDNEIGKFYKNSADMYAAMSAQTNYAKNATESNEGKHIAIMDSQCDNLFFKINGKVEKLILKGKRWFKYANSNYKITFQRGKGNNKFGDETELGNITIFEIKTNQKLVINYYLLNIVD